MQKNNIYTINKLFIAGLFLIIGSINIFSQCAYDYLCKAYSAPRSLKIVYCDSAIMSDSTYIPAYVYKFKAIFYNLPMPCISKPRDTADPAYKEERNRRWKESKAVFERAWQIDSQYFPIYESKLILEGWEHIDTTLYKKLNGEMKFRKDLKYNDINRKCRPNDAMLFLERAQLFSDLSMYDSALIWADKVNFGWQDTVLNLKRSIFIKTSNKSGKKHIENDLMSLKWQKENLWINTIENEIIKASDDCCIRLYCQELEQFCYDDIHFNDLKARCKIIMKKYSKLKPFENKNCHERYGKCKNVWDLY